MTGWDYIFRALEVYEWCTDPARHFLFSAVAGSLVFFLTLTILSACGWVWERGTRKHISSAAAYIIILFCLLLAISAALGLHYLLDFGYAAYTTPLDPPLDLVIP